MGTIGQQLFDLVLSAVPTYLILLFLYVFLQAVFFKPLNAVLAERHARTEGARQGARSSMAAAEAKAAEYAAAFAQARNEVYRGREGARRQAQEDRAALLEKTRAAAGEEIAGARKQIEAEVAASRTFLRAESSRLAESIVKAILR